MVFVGLIAESAKALIQPLFLPFLYWALGSLGTILNAWTNADRLQDENDFINPLSPRPYDFIIVGAGSAGCLLANRLSRSYSVLLIEAGGEPNPLQFIPGFSMFFPNFPEVDWMHRSVPQRFGSLISANGESSWSTGLGLGGTGNLNFMIHLRGHRRDFDNWARITGDPSWSWEGVLPYFKSYENYQVPGDNVNHGYSGDVRIEQPDHPPTARGFVRAAAELGFPIVDLNAPYGEGFDILRYPMSRGVRQAPYKALLEPIRYRKSLTIMKFAQVNKILFRDGNVAYGVEYDRHGRTYMAYANREVIISSGAVGSPKILMLSGIGPRAHLQELNIPVISDLPVGQNLQDHLGAILAPMFVTPGTGMFLDRDITIGQFIKWFTLGRGRLTNTGCEATGLFSSEFAKARNEGDWPDIQLFAYGLTNFRTGPDTIARIFNFKYDEVDRYMRGAIGRDSLFIVVSGARPIARGFIRLGGSSPYDKLIIDPNYLGDEGETDLNVLLEGVKRSLFMMENTTAGMQMGATFTTNRLPGCEHLEFRSDAYWICFIRRFSVTLHHPTGTTAMGTVVDSELRVMGVRGLRVVDAGVQPVVVTTNTQASTLMIAEKAADMITRFWRDMDRPVPGGASGGGGFKKGLLWWANKRKDVGVIKQAPRNGTTTTTAGGTAGGGIRMNDLMGINVQPDMPEIDPLPPTGIPMRINASVAAGVGGVADEEAMRMRFQQTFENLKMVSELARDRYNKNFKTSTTTTTTTQVPVTTARPGLSSTVSSNQGNVGNQGNLGIQGNLRQKGDVGWKGGQGNELDYYYDDDGREDSDYEDKQNRVPTPSPPPSPPAPLTSQKSLTRTVFAPVENIVPRPPSPPQPPQSLDVQTSPSPPPPQRNQSSPVNTLERIKDIVVEDDDGNLNTGGIAPEFYRGKNPGAVGSKPNSVDDVEQYFHNKYLVGFNNF